MYPQQTGTRCLHCQSHARTFLRAGIAAGVLVASLAVPVAVDAASARKAVHPKPGEIVLLRDVPTRPATRQAPPALGLLVDAKPNSQVDAALGAMELSDSEAGAVSAPVLSATRMLHGSAGTSSMLAAPHGADGQAAPRGAATNTTPLSVLGNATRGVGSQVTGALQALPLGKPPRG